MEFEEKPNRVLLLSFIRIMPFLIGIIVIAIGFYIFLLNAIFLTNGNTVIGEIISYEQVLRIDRMEEIQRKQKIMYQATISYIVNNEVFHYSPSAYTRNVPKIGRKIKVYHLIDNPWEAKLTSELFLFPSIPLILGISIICVNLFLYVKRKSSNR